MISGPKRPRAVIPPLASISAGPHTQPWFTTQQASNDYETIASKSFTMPADGFITYQLAAKIAFSSDAT